MKTIQYTIRSVPSALDKRLRAKARVTGKSLNQVILEAIAKAEGANTKQDTFHDLDWFVGGKTIDGETFDTAINWLDSLPKELQ